MIESPVAGAVYWCFCASIETEIYDPGELSPPWAGKYVAGGPYLAAQLRRVGETHPDGNRDANATAIVSPADLFATEAECREAYRVAQRRRLDMQIASLRAARAELRAAFPPAVPAMRRVEYFRCWPCHTWGIDMIEIPADTPEDEIEAAIREAVDKILADADANAYAPCTRPAFVGLYHIPDEEAGDG